MLSFSHLSVYFPDLSSKENEPPPPKSKNKGEREEEEEGEGDNLALVLTALSGAGIIPLSKHSRRALRDISSNASCFAA